MTKHADVDVHRAVQLDAKFNDVRHSTVEGFPSSRPVTRLTFPYFFWEWLIELRPQIFQGSSNIVPNILRLLYSVVDLSVLRAADLLSD